jgi:hypothetical protein
MASATTSPTATAAAITAPVTAAVCASVVAAAKILARAVVGATGGIVLRGIVMRREVLGRGSVRIRLAFLSGFGVLVFDGSGRNRAALFLEMFAFSGVRFKVRSVLLNVMSFVLMELFVVRLFVMIGGTGQRFTRKHFDRGSTGGGQRRHGGLRLLVRMTGIVILEVFEDVTDVQEGVAVETNVHEGGLHAGEDACNSSFVDAADEREFFFPLDVNFD